MKDSTDVGCWCGAFRARIKWRSQRKLSVSRSQAGWWVWWSGQSSTGVMLKPPRSWHREGPMSHFTPSLFKVKQCPRRVFTLLQRRMFYLLQCFYNALCNVLSSWNPAESATTSAGFLQKLVQAAHWHCPVLQGYYFTIWLFFFFFCQMPKS